MKEYRDWVQEVMKSTESRKRLADVLQKPSTPSISDAGELFPSPSSMFAEGLTTFKDEDIEDLWAREPLKAPFRPTETINVEDSEHTWNSLPSKVRIAQVNKEYSKNELRLLAKWLKEVEKRSNKKVSTEGIII